MDTNRIVIIAGMVLRYIKEHKLEENVEDTIFALAKMGYLHDCTDPKVTAIYTGSRCGDGMWGGKFDKPEYIGDV